MNAASPGIIKFIKNEEGLRLNVYLDEGRQGLATIGYGHKLAPGSTLKAISQNTADYLFQADLGEVEQYLNRTLKKPLEQCIFDALCDFVYNLGEVAFGRSSILIYLNEGDVINAARMLVDYCHDGQMRVLPGLVRRRLKEAMIMLKIQVDYDN